MFGILADHYSLATIHCYSDVVPLLEVRNLTKVFGLDESPFGGRRSGEVRAVDDVSLDIHEGETLGLVGIDLLKANGSEMRRLRRNMQIIFQDPFGSLDPRFRVEDVIAEPLILHRKIMHESLSRDGRRQRVRELLRAVGMDESAMPRYPHEFSGGQRQRIGIARALALRPKFIVADEPVSALDVSVGAQIVNLLQQLQRDFGLTYLFISHSMPVVRYLSNRIAVMYQGKIVEIGSTEQITAQPQHAYTRKLLAATPEMSAS